MSLRPPVSSLTVRGVKVGRVEVDVGGREGGGKDGVRESRLGLPDCWSDRVPRYVKSLVHTLLPHIHCRSGPLGRVRGECEKMGLLRYPSRVYHAPQSPGLSPSISSVLPSLTVRGTVIDDHGWIPRGSGYPSRTR